MGAQKLESSRAVATGVTATGVIKSPNTCWRFMRGTYCPEELCHYQHGPPLKGNRLARRTAASYGKTACLWFAQGFCKYGDDCNFAHISLDDVKSAQVTSAASPDLQDKVPAVSSKYDQLSDSTQGSPSAESSSKRRPPRTPKSAHPHLQDSQWAVSSSSERRATTPYVMMSPGHTSPHGWAIPPEQYRAEDVEGTYPAKVKMPDVDKSRSRQVYDDNKVLVLSGGVLLGRKHGGGDPVPHPGGNVRPLHIPPELTVAQSSISSSTSSSYSSAEYLSTPVEWTGAYPASWSEDEYEVGYSPTSATPVMGVTPVQWANGYAMHATTIPVPDVHELRMKSIMGSHYPHGEPPSTPSSYPLPPSAPHEITDVFGALQISTNGGPAMLTTEYSSDEDSRSEDELPSHRRSSVSALQHRAVSAVASAQPFRRSSLGAVIELGGKRTSTTPTAADGYTTPVPRRERESGGGHRRNRPSM